MSDEIIKDNNHQIYIDVHGKLCRLLSEANNVANIGFFYFILLCKLNHFLDQRSNLISKSYENSSTNFQINSSSSNTIALIKLHNFSLYYNFMILILVVIQTFAKFYYF